MPSSKNTISDKLLPVHKRFNISFIKGKGAYLFTDAKDSTKKYLDFGAGIAVNVLGHCHPKLVKAISAQAKKLWHVSNIYTSDQLNNYAEKLVAASFADYAFFCNSGAESIECAIKMIRRNFFVSNQKEKFRIITFSGAFHGRTIATISAAAKPKYLEGFEPALAGFDNVPFGDLAAVKSAINQHTAGILIEPIQGEEGVRVGSKEFIRGLRKLADENNLLLAFDEVQCGMGRTGHLFAYEYYGVKPDIISLAKAIGGGFPLGACLATKEAAIGMTAGVHGTTYGGNPLAMAVADAVLDELISAGFLTNVQKLGAELRTALLELQQQFSDLILEVRGVGLMLGIKISDKVVNTEVAEKFLQNLLLTVPASENVIRIIPPLNITSAQIKEAKRKMEKSLTELRKV